jgi:hypothetical protein
MILDMIQHCRYLRRSTDRWLLSKNSTTRLKRLKSWHGAGLLWNCSIPITNTKGSYLYPGSNTIPSRQRLQHLLPKINTTAPSSVSHPSSICPLLYIQITSSHIPECFPLSPVEQFFCRNDDVPPTADASTECFKKNLLLNGALLPNSAYMSVFSLHQFLVLTVGPPHGGLTGQVPRLDRSRGTPLGSVRG